jgi:hypothetical protein
VGATEDAVAEEVWIGRGLGPAGRASCAEGGHFVTCVLIGVGVRFEGPPVGRRELVAANGSYEVT